jgi:hypothetical protein
MRSFLTTAQSSAAVPVARLHSGTLAWSLGIISGLLLIGKLQTGKKARYRWTALAGIALML